MTQLRILQVSPYYYPELKFGGPVLKMFGLARGLRAKDCQVSVITFNSEDRRARSSRTMEDMEVRYLPWRGWGTRQFPRGSFLLERAVADADIVHTFGLYNFLVPSAARYCRQLGKPLVLEPLGTFKPQARNVLLKRAYHAVFTRGMFASAEAVIATSAAEKNDLAQAVPASRLFQRENGLDLSAFRNMPARDVSRAAFGARDGATVILFMGRLSPIKNLEMLISSFRDAAIPQGKLLLVGPDNEVDYVSRLRRLINESGLENHVVITGPLYDERRLQAFAAADFFVLPSISESYGNAAAEAVASGLSVVLTDSCGIAPRIAGQAALIVPCTRVGLTGGLRHMADAANRRCYALNRDQLVAGLAWDEPVKQQMKIYRTVLAARRPTSAHTGSPGSQ